MKSSLPAMPVARGKTDQNLSEKHCWVLRGGGKGRGPFPPPRAPLPIPFWPSVLRLPQSDRRKTLGVREAKQRTEFFAAILRQLCLFYGGKGREKVSLCRKNTARSFLDGL